MEQISCTEFLEKYDPDKIYKNKHQFPIIGALLYELSNPKSYCFNLYTKSVDIYFTYKEEPIVLKYFINKLEYEDDTPFKTHYNSSFLSNCAIVSTSLQFASLSFTSSAAFLLTKDCAFLY